MPFHFRDSSGWDEYRVWLNDGSGWHECILWLNDGNGWEVISSALDVTPSSANFAYTSTPDSTNPFVASNGTEGYLWSVTNDGGATWSISGASTDQPTFTRTGGASSGTATFRCASGSQTVDVTLDFFPF